MTYASYLSRTSIAFRNPIGSGSGQEVLQTQKTVAGELWLVRPLQSQRPDSVAAVAAVAPEGPLLGLSGIWGLRAYVASTDSVAYVASVASAACAALAIPACVGLRSGIMQDLGAWRCRWCR